jgi:hypothetical protein
MLCRRCETRSPKAPYRGAPSPARVWGVERLRELLCTGCGAVLAGEVVAQRLLEKQSQLAQFGLAGPASPLLTSPHPKGE